MIVLQAATTILVAVIAIAFLADWLAERHDLHALEHDLTELEVQQHIYPNGNVHLITPAPEAEAMSPDGEKD